MLGSTMLVALLQLVLVVQGVFIDKVVKLDKDHQVLDDLNFESGFGSWEHSNLKLVNTNQTEYSMLASPTRGMVVVPQTTMQGEPWGRMAKDLELPAHMQVKMEFSLYVSGFNISALPTHYLPDQPDLNVTLSKKVQGDEDIWGGEEEVTQSDEDTWGEAEVVTNLHRLNPPSSKWTRYQTSVTTNSSGTFRFSLSALSGGEGGVIALDDIRFEGYPLAGEEYEDVSQDGNIDSFQSNSSSNTAQEDTPTNITEDEGELTTTLPSNNITSANSSTALEEGIPQNSTDSSGYPVYGYTSQVVLICLTVLFGVLTLVVGYKYHRLRSHAGDYRLSPNQLSRP